MKLPRVIGTLLALGLAADAPAYSFLGYSWPSGNIPLRLQLDATAPTSVAYPLTDGARSWNAVAQGALADWNAVLRRSQFTSTISNSTAIEYDDSVNQVIFASTAYGMAITSRYLAATYLIPHEYDRDSTRTIEADIIVNLEYAWNSYRGTQTSNTFDLRRVLLHELGHVIGLNHPDEASPRQSVTAVMNSSGSLVETLQADDIAGGQALYDAMVPRPVITTQPVSRTVNAATSVTLPVAVNGRAPVSDAFHCHRWYFRAPGATEFEMLFTLHRPGSLDFGLAQPSDSGSYYFRVTTPDHTVDSEIVTLTVNPVATNSATRLSNLSTRGRVSPGANMIVGFVVTGTRPKIVLLRAIGPTLGQPPFNISGSLFTANLSLKNSAGTIIATSIVPWTSSPGVAAIREATSRVGGFPLPEFSRDAVILATLPPGGYTAEVEPGSGGVVLVEAYDADLVPDPGSRLANLSTRGFVDAGVNLMIAGFVVSGSGPRNYLIRVVGDTLKDFGVSSTLDDPYLRLYRSDGTQIRELDDWDSPAALQPMLRTVSTQAGAFALTDRQECAMVVTLPPGGYTAHVQSFEGPNTVTRGNALIELYELP